MKNRIHRKNSVLAIILSICVLVTSCGQAQNTQPMQVPEISQIKTICQLSVMECYYHDVAKSEKKAGTGLVHIFEEDREMWVEYSAIVKLGIEMSEVQMIITGSNVQITIPDAKIIGEPKITLDSDIIVSEDSWLNSNPITADDQTEAIRNAKIKMTNEIENDTELLASAKERAKGMIENYVNKLGEATGRQYVITWKDVDEENDSTDANTTDSQDSIKSGN